MSAVPRAYSYIRFSMPSQAEGSSLKRQMDEAKAYAKKKNLVLDTALTIRGVTTELRDLGISGYRGKNRKRGALSVFLDAVKHGFISKGSLLIVENLDRLSREEATEALELFLTLIRSGIIIVTLSPHEEYSKQTVNNENRLWMAIGIIYRAHEESKTKGNRIRKSWAFKRKALEKKVMLTKVCPAWLRPKPDRSGFVVIPKRAGVIRRIYRLARSGLSKLPIARQLNTEKIKAWNGSNGWHPTYIQRILNTPAVFGRFQPHRYTEEGREKEGEPIDNYYPKVISREEYEAVKRKAKGIPGRTGPREDTLSNLVATLVWDGYDPSAIMHFMNKGRKAAHHRCCHYFISDATRKGQGLANCWNYVKFEELFLEYLRELDWSAVAREANPAAIEAWEKKRLRVAAEQEDLEKRLNYMRELVQTRPATQLPKTIIEDMILRENEIKAKKQEAADLERTAEQEHVGFDSIREGGAEIRKLLDTTDFMTRLRLREEIRNKICRIDLFSHGLDHYEIVPGLMATTDLPCYKLTFRNGTCRWVAVRTKSRQRKKAKNAPLVIDAKNKRVTLIDGKKTWDITSLDSLDMRPIKLIPPPARNKRRTKTIVESFKNRVFKTGKLRIPKSK